MAANPTEKKQRAGQATAEEPRHGALITSYVLRALGEPGSLQRVQVRPLWDDHYRVNVLVGADAASSTVAHSYFLRADGEGNVLACTPKIIKAY